jgi:hypothetical protein
VEYSPNAFKLTLLFPMYDTKGEPFSESVWDWWRTEFTKLTTGFTELGQVVGWWQGQTDRNRLVFVIISSGAENRLDAVRRFLADARVRFRQAAMYFELHPVQHEEIV